MTILRMQDISDERLDVFCGLTNHQLRNSLDPQRGIVIVESEIAIRVALARGIKPVSFLLDERKLEAMRDVLEEVEEDVPIFVLPASEAERLTGYRVTRGALCAMRRPLPQPLAQAVQDARNVVVLEGITDTSNVGAVFRNAAALGADAIVTAPTCADPMSRRAVRVSMGNVFLVPWAQGGNDVVDVLKECGFTCMALALTKDAVGLREAASACGRKHALFFGSEGKGLSQRTLDACDQAVIIPMHHGVDSLNVAASSAVAMWELFT